MCITSGCLTWYSVLVGDDPLLASSSIILILNIVELIFMSYYAYYNRFESIPHLRFSQRKLDIADSLEEIV